MQYDLLASSKRLESRSRDADRAAQRKEDRQRLKSLRAERQAAAEEEARRDRRLAQLAAEEQERLAREAALERTGGIAWSSLLRVAAVSLAPSEARGLRRAGDKVVLPPSAGAVLRDHASFRRGPMHFEVVAASGARTHAGLLDFRGSEGEVQLPPKVRQALWGVEAFGRDPLVGQGEAVQVTYTRLIPGRRVVLQPQSADFQAAVAGPAQGGGEAGQAGLAAGPAVSMEQVLEAALLPHATLTEGDWVEARVGVEPYFLRVREASPGGAVCIVDAEVEAQVDPSLETEARLEQAAAEAEARARALEELRRSEERRRSLQEREAGRAASQAREAEAAEAQVWEAWREGCRQRLAPEPSQETAASSAWTLVVQRPDGTRVQRRFCPGEDADAVFDFVDAADGADRRWARDGYRLASRVPRCVLHRRRRWLGEAGGDAAGSTQTLQGAGLQGPRVLLFMERVGA